MTSLTRSIAAFQTHLDRNFKAVTKTMTDLQQVETMTKNQTDRFKAQVAEMEKRYHRTIEKWEDNNENLEDKTFEELEAKITAISTEFDNTFALAQDFLDQKGTDAIPRNAGNDNRGNNNAQTQVQTRIDDSLKPKDILLKSHKLEEYTTWEKQFNAYHDHNSKVLETQPNTVRRQLLDNCIESSLINALDTDPTVTENTPITGNDSCLSKLKAIFLKDNPLFHRRHNFMIYVQEPNQDFHTFWTNKLMKAKECDLENINREAILLGELIRGVRDDKLRAEFLKQPNPTVDNLVAIAQNWQTASVTGKAFGLDSIHVNKAGISTYKSTKNERWRTKHRNQTSQIENRTRSYSRERDPSTKRTCQGCGGNCTDRKKCPARDMKCFECNIVGHLGRVCRSRNRSKSRARKSEVKHEENFDVRMNTAKVRISSTRTNFEESKPTPLMNVIIHPRKGTSFKFQACPDSGAWQSLISEDLAKTYGMEIDRRTKKKISAVNETNCECIGSTDFQVEFQGQRTYVRALVTSAFTEELLLDHQTLQKLNVLPKTFPNRINVKCSTTTLHEDEDGKFLRSLKNLPPANKVEKAIEKYETVFKTDGPLKTMKGGPMKIHLRKENVKPTHIYNPRKTPYAFQGAAKKKLDEDEALGVIEKVEDVSTWCSAMSFVPKPNGKIRSVIDLTGLNQYVQRPTHPFPCPKDIVATIPADTKVFAVFDATHGYWQLELDEESKPLTTFITEFGRYRYCRAPMGLASSGDEFCARSDKALAGIEGVKKIVDDILIYGRNYEELLQRICKVFQKCQEWGITLSKEKLQLGNNVKFAGYVITDEGTKPDPEKVEAIEKFTVPKNLTDLRSFMGLTNHFADFAPDLKHAMAPMKGLLSKKNAFLWTKEQDESMEKVRKILTDPNGNVLKHYDPTKPVQLLTDASRIGLGYVILQENRIITCGSRFLSPAENNYAVIELEMLAIQWAVLRSRLYLAGKHFEIHTDHKPLLGVVNGKNIDAINNTRLQRMLSKLIGYTFTLKWVPGKLNHIADALSRSPVFKPEDNTDVLVRHVTLEEPDPALKSLIEATTKDDELQKVIEALRNSKNLNDLPKDHVANKYRSFWDALSYDQALLLYHNRIFVPIEARNQILEHLHLQHTGIEKTLRNARQLYFWPKMKDDIARIVSNCEECTKLLPSQALEPRIQTFASRPFEQVSVDLGYQNGTHYLILADRYSGWPLCKPLRKLDTKATIDVLEDWFLEHGKPLKLRSDGGPQFRDEFTTWCRSRNIVHELSSAHHHESNGHAEVAVREMKHLLEKTKSFRKFREALLEWRNTPRFDGLSPSQWLFGRRQRTETPALPKAYERITDETISEHESGRKEKMEKEKNRVDQHSKKLANLYNGDKIIIQNPITKRWDTKGTVIEKRKNGRSYLVKANGRYYTRNRIFLRICPSEPATNELNEPIANESNEPTPLDNEKPKKPELRRSKRHVTFKNYNEVLEY